MNKLPEGALVVVSGGKGMHCISAVNLVLYSEALSVGWCSCVRHRASHTYFLYLTLTPAGSRCFASSPHPVSLHRTLPLHRIASPSQYLTFRVGSPRLP